MLSTQAMRDFAVTLYRQLASEQGGMNLFFSPYSLFSTLALALEGARGETARQLGEVLQLPHTLRYHGDEAQAIPWDTQPLHAAMAALNHQLLGRRQAMPRRHPRGSKRSLSSNRNTSACVNRKPAGAVKTSCAFWKTRWKGRNY